MSATGIKSGRIDANGVNCSYEVHGTGEPLLLLHGGLGSIATFGPCCRCWRSAGR